MWQSIANFLSNLLSVCHQGFGKLRDWLGEMGLLKVVLGGTAWGGAYSLVSFAVTWAGNIVSKAQEMQVTMNGVTALEVYNQLFAVASWTAKANYLVPLDSMVVQLGLVLSLWAAGLAYRLAKSWLPTVS